MKRPTPHAPITRPLLCALLVTALSAWGAEARGQASVEGAWVADRYLLASGTEYPVQGQIFFAMGQWQVLFFVMDEDGEPQRGSGEGGTYERTADGVVFRHLFNLSVGTSMPGLPEAPLRMVARGAEGAPLEPTRVDVVGDVLTLYFPSGNRMTFRSAATGVAPHRR